MKIVLGAMDCCFIAPTGMMKALSTAVCLEHKFIAVVSTSVRISATIPGRV